jgi:hypothetical protein
MGFKNWSRLFLKCYPVHDVICGKKVELKFMQTYETVSSFALIKMLNFIWSIKI